MFGRWNGRHQARCIHQASVDFSSVIRGNGVGRWLDSILLVYDGTRNILLGEKKNCPTEKMTWAQVPESIELICQSPCSM